MATQLDLHNLAVAEEACWGLLLGGPPRAGSHYPLEGSHYHLEDSGYQLGGTGDWANNKTSQVQLVSLVTVTIFQEVVELLMGQWYP